MERQVDNKPQALVLWNIILVKTGKYCHWKVSSATLLHLSMFIEACSTQDAHSSSPHQHKILQNNSYIHGRKQMSKLFDFVIWEDWRQCSRTSQGHTSCSPELKQPQKNWLFGSVGRVCGLFSTLLNPSIYSSFLLSIPRVVAEFWHPVHVSSSWEYWPHWFWNQNDHTALITFPDRHKYAD